MQTAGRASTARSGQDAGSVGSGRDAAVGTAEPCTGQRARSSPAAARVLQGRDGMRVQQRC